MNFLRKLLCFLRGEPLTVNIVSGKEQLDGAFSVFNDAKVKAQEALDTLSRERDKVESEIKVIQEEYENTMKDKNTQKTNLVDLTVNARNFISKIDTIIQ